MKKVYLIGLFFAILCLQNCVSSDKIEKLGDGYFYRDEGRNIKDILCERREGGEIPATVVSYIYNNSFILAKQKPKIPQESLYNNDYQYKDYEEYYYWIILKDKDIVYGPLDLGEYTKLRIKYKIPEDLLLEL